MDEFPKKLEFLLNAYGWDTRLNMADFVIASTLLNFLEALEAAEVWSQRLADEENSVQTGLNQ